MLLKYYYKLTLYKCKHDAQRCLIRAIAHGEHGLLYNRSGAVNDPVY
jgi:hypothetical protein